jgi:hypothetical protein
VKRSKREKRDDWSIGFDAGYVCAVANIIRLHREPGIAKDVLRENPPEAWGDISEYDFKTLKDAKILGIPKTRRGKK